MTRAIVRLAEPIARAGFHHRDGPADAVATWGEVSSRLSVHPGRVRRLVHLQAEGDAGCGDEGQCRPHVKLR